MSDWRWIGSGFEIPSQNYCDQPYVVRTDDGAWLCCMTTGAGAEGAPGQHVVTLRSPNKGASWQDEVSVEPTDGPEASYAVMLKIPSGRIYIFYNHNTDGLREVKLHDGSGVTRRVDSLGHYVFRYSEDHGRSWSRYRHEVPIRTFRCDSENAYGGKVQMFWNVGRPFVSAGAVYVPLHKVGKIGRGFFEQSEGALLRSANLLWEKDPEKITWETLPEGDKGLSTPPGGGPIAEEQSIVELSDGSLCALYRSIDGYPVETYSRDRGRTWRLPRYRRFADGRLMKNPRAAALQWKCANGNYLMWFHNHGGVHLAARPDVADSGGYEDRNPAWLCGGVETDVAEGKEIVWSEPDIVLYDDDPMVRISYPDLIEEDGRYFITETQKHRARVHEIPADFVEGLWASVRNNEPHAPPAGVILSYSSPQTGSVPLPPLPMFTARNWSKPDMSSQSLRNGFSIEIFLRLDSLKAGQILLDNRTGGRRGFALCTNDRKEIEIIMNDGRTENRWASDPVIRAGAWHHVVVIVDAGPRLVSFVVDGRFCDGGDWRQFGWGRFSSDLLTVAGEQELRIASSMKGRIALVRLYERPLKVWEAVERFRATQKSPP